MIWSVIRTLTSPLLRATFNGRIRSRLAPTTAMVLALLSTIRYRPSRPRPMAWTSLCSTTPPARSNHQWDAISPTAPRVTRSLTASTLMRLARTTVEFSGSGDASGTIAIVARWYCSVTRWTSGSASMVSEIRLSTTAGAGSSRDRPPNLDAMDEARMFASKGSYSTPMTPSIGTTVRSRSGCGALICRVM
uniref:Uncharacterized protein n=1 Tax=uncultured marine microorganism HF4000_137B17 TaxID=455523 RepID=B3T261_9ZZZZ|nr:hypothetical protein ALOHA_HF4000137B17ctg1g7 [uncultured marine microorganism HF4000_137B17]